MKFKLNKKVKIKSLDEMLNEGVLKIEAENLYINEEARYYIFKDFPFFGLEGTITKIDDDDDSCPYYISNGKDSLWACDFMLTSLEAQIPMDNAIPVNVKPKVYINKFNNKPFGKLFIKLINLDNKIAEFSSTAFSRLKKHELQYIARLLMKQNCPFIDINSSVAELSSYCYNQTRSLNV